VFPSYTGLLMSLFITYRNFRVYFVNMLMKRRFHNEQTNLESRISHDGRLYIFCILVVCFNDARKGSYYLALNTRAVREVSSHLEYLENRTRGVDVTSQPVRRDLTVRPWTVTSVGLVSRQWDAVDWAYVLFDSHVHIGMYLHFAGKFCFHLRGGIVSQACKWIYHVLLLLSLLLHFAVLMFLLFFSDSISWIILF